MGPTLPVGKANKTIHDEFYESLNAAISKNPKRDFLCVLGHLNAKTGSLHNSYPNEIGPYGKGHVNENGIALVEFCSQNELFVTNTMFMHRLSHRTTWTAPIRQFTTKDGTKRRNPIRNIIDYIITRKNIKHCVTNARSYGGIDTDTEHKMIITEVNIHCRSLYKRNSANMLKKLPK